MAGRIMILAAIGLGALYVMHLLAQDYNKIRRPIATVAAAATKLLLGKRDLSAVLAYDKFKEHHEEFNAKQNQVDNFKVDWKTILQRDPFRCAISLICQLSAGAEKTNEEAIAMLELIKFSLSKKAPVEVTHSYELGQKYNDQPEKCFSHSPWCPYSARTMFNILKIYSVIFS